MFWNKPNLDPHATAAPNLQPELFRRLLARTTLPPFYLALAIGTLLTWQISRMVAAARWLDHSEVILAQANYTYRLMLDLETGERGYLLTGEPSFLEPYQVSGPRVEPALQRLRQLVNDNPEQTRRVTRLMNHYATWLNLPDIRRDVPAADRGVLLSARKAVMDVLRSDFDDFLIVERSLRDQRAGENEQWARYLIALTVSALVGFTAFFTWIGRRNLLLLSRSYQNQVDAGELALQKQQDLSDDLQRSNTELDQYAHIASHDLKEPLRMITSYLGLLKMRYAGKLDEDAHRFIDFAAEGATRLHTLLTDLLRYSQLENKTVKIAEVDLNAALATALQHLEVAVKESGAQIAGGELPKVAGDEGQLTLLLQNLVANGIKFRRADSPPRITVSAQRRAHEWEVRVQDNGIGIEEEYFPRLFVIFNRLHARHEYPGSGIGLAICKRVVERHRGKIWVESNREGATFAFTLPATEPKSASA